MTEIRRSYAGLFNGAEETVLNLEQNRHVYVHLACGSLAVNGEILHAGDALKITDAAALKFTSGTDAEVLVFVLASATNPQKH